MCHEHAHKRVFLLLVVKRQRKNLTRKNFSGVGQTMSENGIASKMRQMCHASESHEKFFGHVSRHIDALKRNMSSVQVLGLPEVLGW